MMIIAFVKAPIVSANICVLYLHVLFLVKQETSNSYSWQRHHRLFLPPTTRAQETLCRRVSLPTVVRTMHIDTAGEDISLQWSHNLQALICGTSWDFKIYVLHCPALMRIHDLGYVHLCSPKSKSQRWCLRLKRPTARVRQQWRWWVAVSRNWNRGW